jgi:trehalose 6-phosphate synthase/phosphatase
MPAPLVVVSNRLPFAARRRGGQVTLTRSPGGLVSALDPVLQETGGRWVGWLGLSREELDRAGGFPLPARHSTEYVTVELTQSEVTQYYGQFANRTLWPLFHYFLQYVRYDSATWAVYDRVNDRFAEAAAGAVRDDAIVWIHDYQLLRTPLHVRRRLPDVRMGFFLHIPFPAADVFRTLPWCRLLLRGMLGADHVGFHTVTDAGHFLDAAERLLGCEVDRGRGQVHHEGRLVTAAAHPIGIDAALMEEMARQALADEPRAIEDLRMILGVDRLDYTKGLPGRLLAVERLFERHPEHRGRVAFTQIAVPSRERVPEYGALKREIDEHVGRINGRFAEPGWHPIRYLSRSLDQETLAGLYARADVALVTPLRDGMNLVAKEYCAAQVGEPGVLVLSELAGASEELQEAMMVNPFDVDAMTEALHAALAMSPEERRARMAALRDRVRSQDAHAWARGFLETTARSSERTTRSSLTPVERLTRRLEPWLARRERTALFLDYDGTLTPIVERPGEARLGPAGLRALDAVVTAHHLDVAIVSGRGLEDLRTRLPATGMTLVGNHGLEVEGPGIRWRHPDSSRWAAALARAATELTALDEPGAWVEAKGLTLSWHIRQVPADRQEVALRRGEKLITGLGLRTHQGKMVLEARPPVDWHKGRAVLFLLRHRYGDAWPTRIRAIYIGDDRTDEDAFATLHRIGRSIRVGSPDPSSTADHALPDPAAVLRLMRWLAAGAYLGPDR